MYKKQCYRNKKWIVKPGSFKQQETKWSEERFKHDADRNALRNYEYARRELTDYVKLLRQQGYNI